MIENENMTPVVEDGAPSENVNVRQDLPTKVFAPKDGTKVFLHLPVVKTYEKRQPQPELEAPAPQPEPEVPVPAPEPEVPAPAPELEAPAPQPEPEVPVPAPEPEVPAPAPAPEPEAPVPAPEPEAPAPVPRPEVPVPAPEPYVPLTEVHFWEEEGVYEEGSSQREEVPQEGDIDDGQILDATFELPSSDHSRREKFNAVQYTPSNNGVVNISEKFRLTSIFGKKTPAPIMEIIVTVDAVRRAIYCPNADAFPISFGRKPKTKNASAVRLEDDTLENDHLLVSLESGKLVITNSAKSPDRVVYYTPEGAINPFRLGNGKADSVTVGCAAFVVSFGNVSMSVRLLPESARVLQRTCSLSVQTYRNGWTITLLSLVEGDYLAGRQRVESQQITVFPLNLDFGLIAKAEGNRLVSAADGIVFTVDGNSRTTEIELKDGGIFNIFYRKMNLMQITVTSVFDPLTLFGLTAAPASSEKRVLGGTFRNVLKKIGEPELIPVRHGRCRDKIFEVTVYEENVVSKRFTLDMSLFPVYFLNNYNNDMSDHSQLVIGNEKVNFCCCLYVDADKDRPYFFTESIEGVTPNVTGMKKTGAYGILLYDITAADSSFSIGSTKVEVKILPESTERHFHGVDYVCEVVCLLAKNADGYAYPDVGDRISVLPKIREIIIHNSTTFGRNPDADVFLIDARDNPVVSLKAFHAEEDSAGLMIKSDNGVKAFVRINPITEEFVISSEVPLDPGVDVQYRDAYLLRITGMYCFADKVRSGS